MKYIIPFLIVFVFTSCMDGDWFGATAGGDCDELCTVYNAPKNIIMQEDEIYDKNFPDQYEREGHVEKLNDVFKIKSWYYTIDNQQDTIYTDFSCTVHYDSEKIEYIVEDLKRNCR
jgi:hypothetical protein